MKEYEYMVDVGSGMGTGSVIVDDDATEDEIELAILHDLYDVEYKEVRTWEN